MTPLAYMHESFYTLSLKNLTSFHPVPFPQVKCVQLFLKHLLAIQWTYMLTRYNKLTWMIWVTTQLTGLDLENLYWEFKTLQLLYHLQTIHTVPTCSKEDVRLRNDVTQILKMKTNHNKKFIQNIVLLRLQFYKVILTYSRFSLLLSRTNNNIQHCLSLYHGLESLKNTH